MNESKLEELKKETTILIQRNVLADITVKVYKKILYAGSQRDNLSLGEILEIIKELEEKYTHVQSSGE